MKTAVQSALDAIAQAIPDVARFVSWTGKRRTASAVRKLDCTVRVIATEGDGGAEFLTGAAAPTDAQQWTLRLLERDWPDETPPEVEDVVTFEDGSAANPAPEPFAVSSVVRHVGGYWTVIVQPRKKRSRYD